MSPPDQRNELQERNSGSGANFALLVELLGLPVVHEQDETVTPERNHGCPAPILRDTGIVSSSLQAGDQGRFGFPDFWALLEPVE